MRASIKSAGRRMFWILVLFGLGLAGCGVWIWLSTGGKDVGGILSGVFLFGGVSMAILAFPNPTEK